MALFSSLDSIHFSAICIAPNLTIDLMWRHWREIQRTPPASRLSVTRTPQSHVRWSAARPAATRYRGVRGLVPSLSFGWNPGLWPHHHVCHGGHVNCERCGGARVSVSCLLCLSVPVMGERHCAVCWLTFSLESYEVLTFTDAHMRFCKSLITCAMAFCNFSR